MLFREVYRFRQQIVSGSFDLILVKPINVLFRSLFGWTDLLDSINLVPLIFMIIFVATKIGNITALSVVIYCLLIINSLLIAMSFHIIVLALAILTTEIDHAVMIYRDFTSMGRFPIDIYKEPLRSLVTFAIPIGIMMTIPTKALMGLINTSLVLISFAIGFSIFIASIMLWRYALKRYTSASS